MAVRIRDPLLIPRSGNVPRTSERLDIVQLDRVAEGEREADRAYALATGPIPGVDLGSNPLDIRSPDDLKVIEGAVRRRWNVSPHMKDVILSTMMRIVETSSEEANQIAAAKVVLTADKLSLDEEKRHDVQKTASVNVNVTADSVKQLTMEQLQALLNQSPTPP